MHNFVRKKFGDLSAIYYYLTTELKVLGSDLSCISSHGESSPNLEEMVSVPSKKNSRSRCDAVGDLEDRPTDVPKSGSR
jgi:hypothetical protein